MTQVGATVRARDIGKRGNDSQKYVWAKCVDCGKERWVTLTKGGPASQRCKRCSNTGEHSSQWAGGRITTREGYIVVRIPLQDFFAAMASRVTAQAAYVFEHRLVAARHLGRCLQPWEVVHHKNGMKGDNRIENLEVMTKGAHRTEHDAGYRKGYQQGLIDGRDAQIKALHEDIRLLRWQLLEANRSERVAIGG